MGYLKLFLEQLKYSWFRKLSLQLTTLLVMTGSFLVVTVTTLILTNTNKIFNDVAESFQVSVYLTEQGELKEQKSKILSLINKTGLFSDINFVSKDLALNEFKSKMKEQMPSFVLEEGEVNPLPSSFSLKIKKEFNTKAGFGKISDFAEELLSVLGIEDVAYGKGWATQYSSFLAAYNIGSIVFILFLLVSILLVVGNSIKSSISQRRKEIEVLELVGATRAYIRLPFIMEGAFMGLVSSVLSIVITYILFQSVSSLSEQTLGGSLLGGVTLNFLSTSQFLTICFISTLIGAIGAAVSIRRMNTGWAALSE